ncbi:hypothetical protein D9M72_625110 [compost metagenome]
MATKLNKPLMAFSRVALYISSTNTSTSTLRLVLPTFTTRPTNSTMEPAGIGCLKPIRSLDTVTSGRRQKRVAVMNDTSSIQARTVPPNRVL